MEAVKYKKLGSAGAEGVDYQLSLILTTLFRAHKLHPNKFLIYSEWPLAGYLDDVVLQIKDHQNEEHFRFLQAKHVVDEKKTITYKDLISNDKFKIEKYFDSYKNTLVKEEKFKGKMQDLILFSNLTLNKDVEPYVEKVPARDSIFHFHQTNGKKPTMHKLNLKFIEDYQYSKLRGVVKVFLDYCLNGTALKSTNNSFKDCHVIMSTEVVNVEEGKFHEKFINAKDLSEGTKQFRKILLEELKLQDNTCSSEESQKAWMRGVSLKFVKGFGSSTNKNGANYWPQKSMSSKDESSFKEFCNLFVLATSQPNDEELSSLVNSECEGHCRKSLEHLAADYLQNKIRRWFKTPEELPLNFMFVKEAMDYIKNNEVEMKFINQTEGNIQALSLPLKLEFQRIPYEEDLQAFLESEENVFRIISNGSIKVSLLKLFNCIDKQPRQIAYHFSPESETPQSNDFFEAFKNSAVYNLLICEMRNNVDDIHLEERLEQLIEDKKSKKIIFVYNQQVASGMLKRKTESFCDHTFFKDMTQESQTALSQRIISFQGADVAFNSIYGKEIPPNHQDIESWELLLENQFKMNKTIANSDLSYYVNRTLKADIPYFNKDTIQRKLGDQHILTYNRLDFNSQINHHPTKHVHLLYELDGFWCVARSNGKIRELMKSKEGTRKFKFNDNDGAILQQLEGVFVISDMAGYGKTTTTSYLANELQKQHPNGWVTRLQPSNLRFDADEIELTPEADVGKYDAFLMEKLFNLSSPLERLIFKQYLEDEESESQLFFIFDGFDEIIIKYQRVIIQAVKYLMNKRNVKFIGIGTRPQHQEQLEDDLQSLTFKLLPFSQENKITFLKKFWLSRGVKGQNEQLRDFSERLIKEISKSISDKESALTGIPLQMRMIGEIYKENAIKYLGGNLDENEIVAVDLFGLYEQFIRKKEDLYFDDKVGATPGAALIDIFLKNPRKTQTEFAIKVILGGDCRDMEEQLKDTIPLGIIQDHQGVYSFIHRTFAEFLFAKYILDYTQSESKRVDIDHLMQVMYDEDYEVVRKFINSKLDYKEMASEIERPEYEEAIKNINHEEFQWAMETSAKEGTYQVFCFQLEFYSYWYPEEMKEFLIRDDDKDFYKTGLLYRLCSEKYFKYNISLCIHYMTIVWLTSDHNASELLLEMLKYLITQLFEYPWGFKLTVKIVTDLQDALEEKQILSEKCLKSILLGKSYDYDSNEVMWILKYLKHLKVKHEQLIYSLLREKKELVQRIVSRFKNDEFYELFGEPSDPNIVYSALVVPVFSNIHPKCRINFGTYLKFISKYIRHFDGEQLEEFKTGLFSYLYCNGWYNSNDVDSQVRSLLEFLRNHRDIISLEEFMQDIKIHKNLSFIENCALWGWEEDLEYILDAGGIEVEKVKRLQLERCESLDEKIKCILQSIRDNNTDEQLMEIARVNCEYGFGTPGYLRVDVTFLSKAILKEDELRIETYSTWITSDELFDAFMTDTPVTEESVKFVIERFPQHKMRFFEINKNGFVRAPKHHSIYFPSILAKDNFLNKDEFLRLNQLQNDNGETILFNICNKWDWEETLEWSDIHEPLFVWLHLMKRECTTDDIVRLFRSKNGEGKTVLQILNNKSIYSDDPQIECKSFIYLFFERMKLGDLMAEIDIGEEEVKDVRRWFDKNYSKGYEGPFYEDISAEEESSDDEESTDDEEISEDKEADVEDLP